MSNYLQLADGALYYTDQGQGHPIICLHGGPAMSHNYLQPVMMMFQALGHRAIGFDQRGNGLSNDFPIESVSIQQIVEDIERIRQALSLDKITLFGHSFGGYIALEYAKKYPQHLHQMILCSSAPSTFATYEATNLEMSRRLNLSPEEEEAIAKSMADGDISAIGDYLFTSISHQFKDHAMGVDFTQDVKNHNIDMMRLLRLSRVLMEEYIQSFHTEMDIIDTTTLVLHGEVEPIPVQSSQDIAAHLPQSTLIVIKDSGHYPFLENAEQTQAVLEEFIQSATI